MFNYNNYTKEKLLKIKEEIENELKFREQNIIIEYKVDNIKEWLRDCPKITYESINDIPSNIIKWIDYIASEIYCEGYFENHAEDCGYIYAKNLINYAESLLNDDYHYKYFNKIFELKENYKIKSDYDSLDWYYKMWEKLEDKTLTIKQVIEKLKEDLIEYNVGKIRVIDFEEWYEYIDGWDDSLTLEEYKELYKKGLMPKYKG